MTRTTTRSRNAGYAVDPRTVLTPQQLAEARAIVATVPRLSTAQTNLVAAVFRPVIRQALAHHRQTQPT